jgi:hypothetical protein
VAIAAKTAAAIALTVLINLKAILIRGRNKKPRQIISRVLNYTCRLPL